MPECLDWASLCHVKLQKEPAEAQCVDLVFTLHLSHAGTVGCEVQTLIMRLSTEQSGGKHRGGQW